MNKKDHNGQITFDEIKKVFGGVCDEKTIKQIIEEVDIDHDCQISFAEFKAMMDRFNDRMTKLGLRSLSE